MTSKRAFSVIYLVLVLNSYTLAVQASGKCLDHFGGSSGTITPGKIVHLKPPAIEEAQRKRACTMSYGWPKGMGEHGEKVTADQMKNLRSRMRELWNMFDSGTYRATFSDLPEHDQIKLLRMEIGWDREQVGLFGDLFVIKKLMDERRYAEAAREAKSVTSRKGFSVDKAQWTNADQATFFSIQNLRNIIHLQGAVAQTRLPLRDLKAELNFATNFFDNRLFLSGAFGLFGDPTEAIAMRASGLSEIDLTAPYWQLFEKLDRVEQLEGFNHSDNGEVIFYLRGKKLHTLAMNEFGDMRYVEPKEASEQFRAFCLREIREHSTPEMSLFNVMKYGNSYEVDIAGGTVAVSAAEYNSLSRGTPLASEHPLTMAINKIDSASVVLYSNPFMMKKGKTLEGIENFAYALQKSYPGKRIYRDPLSEETNQQVALLNRFTVTGPADAVAIVARDSFNVTDYKIVQNISAELEANGIRVLSVGKGEAFTWEGGKSKALIVITGHIDKELAEFVRWLGEAGVFAENYVLFNSCRDDLSRGLAAEINTRYGAVATFTHEGKILPDDLEPFLAEFGERISNGLQKTFGEALLETLSTHSLNGTWTVCQISKRTTTCGA